MNALPTLRSWQITNQRYLQAAIDRIHALLKNQIDPENAIVLPDFPATIHSPPALVTLCRTFNLSNFERDCLLLCAGMDFDHHWASLCAEAQANSQRPYPTFSLALNMLPDAVWEALSPEASLRRWRMIEIGAGNALTTSPIRIDERVLHYLAGVNHLDQRLAGLIEAIDSETPLVSSYKRLAKQIIQTWAQSSQAAARLPIIQLCGGDIAGKQSIAVSVCNHLKLRLHQLAVEMLPTDFSQLNLFKELCEREHLLSNLAILIDRDQIEQVDSAKEAAIARFIETANLPIILLSYDRYMQRQRAIASFEVQPPTSGEQRLLWQDALGETAATLNGQLDSLVSHFNLSPTAIQAVSWQLELEQDADSIHTQLWNACRIQARPRLDELAQRIEASATWEDLILPEKEQQILREVAVHVKQRSQVYEQWGFGRRSKRGLGISALFAGASGTGKTTAAEVLGQALKLDVYRIDVSSVVSKYIGETEKNLRRVFDAAEGGGVILLFDEADALFGKRGEVSDSRDRYANLEVGYLLQRMESYRGLAVLTTNLKNSIDQAFLRRIRFVVHFPFPDAVQRAEIWRRVFPIDTPTRNLDAEKLARLNLAGGNIRNIALNAAFLAAEAQEPVEMKHILQATRSEYLKLERPLTDAEVKGWV